MNRSAHFAALLFFASLSAGLAFHSVPARAQNEPSSERDATREQLRQVLETGGARADVGVAFRQSTKNPYNFVGSMTTGLINSESLEIVISVTKSSTIGFRIYPHYRGGYINLGRARDRPGLMRALLGYNDNNFLFWGADDTSDVFAGYTFTLESGFPSDAIIIVLRSIRNQDKYVGEMRPVIDGTVPPAAK
jgi:hypothetical protein